MLHIIKSIKNHLVTLKKPKKKDYSFMGAMSVLWIVVNISIIVFFGTLYYLVDINREESYFRGLGNKDARTYFDYIYFSVVVTTTLGLGEIVPHTPVDEDGSRIEHRSKIGRIIVMIHILFSVYSNDVLDTWENLHLA